jgi:hypothetical protein
MITSFWRGPLCARVECSTDKVEFDSFTAAAGLLSEADGLAACIAAAVPS